MKDVELALTKTETTWLALMFLSIGMFCIFIGETELATYAKAGALMAMATVSTVMVTKTMNERLYRVHAAGALTIFKKLSQCFTEDYIKAKTDEEFFELFVKLEDTGLSMEESVFLTVLEKYQPERFKKIFKEALGETYE